MAKNTVSTPIKDGVKADNSTYSSNQIEKALKTMDTKIDVSMAEINKKINAQKSIFEINVDYNSGSPTTEITFEELLEAYNKEKLILINISGISTYVTYSVISVIGVWNPSSNEYALDLHAYGIGKSDKVYYIEMGLSFTPWTPVSITITHNALN